MSAHCGPLLGVVLCPVRTCTGAFLLLVLVLLLFFFGLRARRPGGLVPVVDCASLVSGVPLLLLLLLLLLLRRAIS